MKPVAYINTNTNELVWYADYKILAKKYELASLEPLYAIDFTKYKLIPREPTKSALKRYFFNENIIKQYWKRIIEESPDIEDL